jgi:flagellar hook-basal body complex protein FliE
MSTSFSFRVREWLLEPLADEMTVLRCEIAAMRKEIQQMATSQDQFNQDLTDFLGEVKDGVNTLLQKVDDLTAQVAAGKDFTAADEAVQAAKAELESTLGTAPAPPAP